MTDQSGGGSPVWLGVALIFVGLASKDLFISDQQGELLHYEHFYIITIFHYFFFIRIEITRYSFIAIAISFLMSGARPFDSVKKRC